MKRYMKRPSSRVFHEPRPYLRLNRLIYKGEAMICQQCQAKLMGGTRFWFCHQCETRFPRNFAHENPEYQEAIEHYTEAIQLDPDYAKAYLNRGYAYDGLGQHQRAIEDFDKAIQLEPDDAVAYNNRGAAYYYLGQYQRAIEDYDKAIQLDPDYAPLMISGKRFKLSRDFTVRSRFSRG